MSGADHGHDELGGAGRQRLLYLGAPDPKLVAGSHPLQQRVHQPVPADDARPLRGDPGRLYHLRPLLGLPPRGRALLRVRLPLPVHPFGLGTVRYNGHLLCAAASDQGHLGQVRGARPPRRALLFSAGDSTSARHRIPSL